MDDTKPPPFTLEEAEKWLHWLEDVATLERDSGFAARFVLGNLLMLLDRNGVIAMRPFLLRLREAAGHMEQANHRLATEVFLDDLLLQADTPGDGGYGPPPRH